MKIDDVINNIIKIENIKFKKTNYDFQINNNKMLSFKPQGHRRSNDIQFSFTKNIFLSEYTKTIDLELI